MNADEPAMNSQLLHQPLSAASTPSEVSQLKVFVRGVPLHQDGLGAIDHGSSSRRAATFCLALPNSRQRRCRINWMVAF